MNITGIAHNPAQLHERTEIPSPELIYLARLALKKYQARRVTVSLEPGWEMAMAKAALELKIPVTVAIPYPGRDGNWSRPVRQLYLELLAHADEVFQVSGEQSDCAGMDGRMWEVDQADVVLALWEFDFDSEVFDVMEYALHENKTVVNLWQDWTHLYSLRRQKMVYTASSPRGAQVFNGKQGPEHG